MRRIIKIILSLSLFLGISLSYGQGGWRKKYYLQNSFTSTSGNVIETPIGELITVGVTYDTLNGYAFNRLTLLGTDNVGNILWRKNYGDYKFEYLNTISGNAVTTVTNGFYLTICVKDSSNKYFSALLKFNYNGDTLWQKIYTSNLTGVNLYLMGMTKSVDNGILLCGFYEDFNLPQEPCVVIKTDINGNELWRSVINKVVPNSNTGSGILQDTATKKIVLVGRQYIGNATGQDIYSNILILDSLGIKLFQTTYNNAEGGGFGSVIQLKDKNFLTGGRWFEQQIGFTTKYKSILVKFNINGGVIWSKKYGTISPFNGMILFSELKNGDILVNGYLDTMQNYLTNPVIKTRLSRIDKNGNLVWHKYIGSSHDYGSSEWASSMNRTQDGGFIISTSFPYIQNNHPYSIIKIDSTGCDTLEAYCANPVGLNNLYKISGYSFEMFPNPSNAFVNFQIEGPGENDFTIKITEISGKEIEQFDLKPNEELQLKTEQYSPGIYFVSVFLDGKSVETKKLVIVK